MEKKEFICIRCPVGCRLTAMVGNGEVTEVRGNTCARGAAYAKQEAVSPTRTLVCLMRARDRQRPFSVKSSVPVPKDMMFRCLNEIYACRPEAPIREHDVLIRNILGTGADIIATSELD